MRKRFIGPENPGPDGADLGHEVIVSGHKLGNVKHGEVLEVPDTEWDALVAEHEAANCPLPVWAEDLWEDVKASAKRKDGDA